MRTGYFLVTLFAFCLLIHLMRFPHLILEHGGGGFLILYILVLNAFAFPMLIAEKAIDAKLKEIDLQSLISVRKSGSVNGMDRFFIASWFGLRIAALLSFLWFFLYIGSSCLVYLHYFISSSLDWSTPATDIPSLPDMKYSGIASGVWVLTAFIVFVRFSRPFFWFFSRWVMPFAFAILFVLFFKVILLVNNFEGLKLLFYPDFLSLTWGSLNAALGQSLACLFIGFGFYNRFFVPSEEVDSIEIFVRAILMASFIAVVVGVMALPMIEQVSETPFGSNWVFQILPRWLSYGPFGNYYGGLFFFSLGLLCFYLAVALHVVVSDNVRLLHRFQRGSRFQWSANLFFVGLNSAMVLYLQGHLQGWSGQSLLINLDRVVIHWILPLFALMMVWILFRYTKKGERLAVFSQQQIFFHSGPFFKLWEKMTLYFVPSLILLGWFLTFL